MLSHLTFAQTFLIFKIINIIKQAPIKLSDKLVIQWNNVLHQHGEMWSSYFISREVCVGTSDNRHTRWGHGRNQYSICVWLSNSYVRSGRLGSVGCALSCFPFGKIGRPYSKYPWRLNLDTRSDFLSTIKCLNVYFGGPKFSLFTASYNLG